MLHLFLVFFIPKICNKIRSSPNLEIYLHMRIENVTDGGRAVFFLSISCSLR